MFELQATSVLVTGGSKGIGRGIASVFAEAGADVAIAARSADDVDAAVADLETRGAGRVLGVRADVCDPMSCAAMAAAVLEAFGGIDVVCANAGIFPEAPLATMTPRNSPRSSTSTSRATSTPCRPAWTRSPRPAADG
jgi:3-oxoacyl-[acyl-carrier protein] reductase